MRSPGRTAPARSWGAHAPVALRSVTFFALLDTLVVVSGFLADAEAFSRFYRGYARSVLLFFARRTIDSEAAPDLTAETFAAAFASRNSFRGATNGEAGAWLLVIARRQLSRYFEAGRCRASSCAGLGVEMPHATDVELERIEALAGLGALRVALREQLQERTGGAREGQSSAAGARRAARRAGRTTEEER